MDLSVVMYDCRKEREPCRYAGKTARSKGDNMHSWRSDSYSTSTANNPYVKAERSLVCEDGLTLFPVTELDQFLRGIITKTGHVLSRDGVWDSFPSSLEMNAASCKSTYHRYYRQNTIVFDVPIIGHLLLSKDEDGRQPIVRQSFMRWNGKLYDRNFIYTLRADRRILYPEGIWTPRCHYPSLSRQQNLSP